MAFLFSLCAILSFLIAFQKQSHLLAALSGFFIGLTGLSHLLYAQFTILFIFIYVLFHSSKRAWLNAVISGGTAILLLITWLVNIYTRYGFSVFTNAFESHGNNSFLSFFSAPTNIYRIAESSFSVILPYPFFIGLLLLGLLYSIVGHKAWISVWFILSLIFLSDNARFLVTIGAFISALLATVLFHSLYRKTKEAKIISYRGLIFGVIISLAFYATGWKEIKSKNIPLINKSSFEVARYINEKTPQSYKYLILATPEEAEWFPYLTSRNPVIGSWGGEWVGTFTSQLRYVNQASECDRKQSFDCLLDLMSSITIQPEYIITHSSSEELNQQISKSNCMSLIYSNPDYKLWEIIDKAQCAD